ncbi:MAG: Trk system potassium transporter TrkA [Mariprofundaceae bacterium]|nr:Trk system potassium transporter TrkA [Mariprofundaceae bacterium]
MNILILGAGEVGFYIAQRLATEGNDVVVVDNDAERLQRVADTMDVRTVLGQASYPSVLRQAGAANAELLIAATTNDETNMLACQVAHSLFKVTTKMARIREPDYVNSTGLFGRDELPIDLIISPEREAANSIVKRFQVSSAVDAQDFADGRVQLLGLRVPPKGILAGLALNELDEVMGDIRTYIVAHEHNRKWCVPKADAVLLAGDSVYIALPKGHVKHFLEHVGYKTSERKNRNVMMVGGGNVGFIVAQQLEKMGASIKLIEHNPRRAQWLAEQLDRSVVIHGSALDRDLLEEEAIDGMDDFLALTNDDETNILASLIAKKYDVPHVITLVNRAIYTDLVRQIGLDITVSPRFTTASSILRHVRKGRILGMSPLGDGTLEVLEAVALETSDILHTPLSELKLPANTVIGAIVRQESVIIPDGTTTIEPDDHVLLVTQSKSLRAVEKLFEVRLEFF